MKERNTSEENIKRRMERRNCFSFADLVLFAVEKKKEKKRNEMGNRGAECVFK